MQRDRAPIVMVIDENGGLRGLVTIEDLVEELVGDILSEGDPRAGRAGARRRRQRRVPGSTPIRDVNRALELDLPEPDGVSTIAGLCIRAAGHLPRTGERVTLHDGHVLEVLDATPRQVRVGTGDPPARGDRPGGGDTRGAGIHQARALTDWRFGKMGVVRSLNHRASRKPPSGRGKR